ncbi:5,6-dimethylbenzimidazole synthase [Roseibium suaedae]|uniref:Cob(II)yrinic acid a,c-diamide reductase n=1 Tax=Roseibium suaedae TaxID=735517 RepID=A0A1M7HRA4_9HYPH|nr:5,6-dimethylbenzimidazole synthase [Roseibium suaedae]SHM31015.1 cob(II)yrinic acid a,c-diamide reductase [Roseibium suaedae]
MSGPRAGDAPVFRDAFCEDFETLVRWRRDVRRFRSDPLPDGVLSDLLEIADLAPSVGNSQPWRLVLVEDAARRGEIVRQFEGENAAALAQYRGDRADTYASLKLAGLREAPVHLAVFCDNDPEQGHGLGRSTMPETLAYSVVGMIQTLWLAARARGVGLGWVSILDPKAIAGLLDVPQDWAFIGYLCLGYPEEEHEDPELERAGWQARTKLSERLLRR